MAKLTTSLQLNSSVYGGGKKQNYSTTHAVTSAFDTTFRVNNSDTFKQIIDFKPDGSKTYNKFNYLLLANDGDQSAELQIVLREFIADAGDATDDVASAVNPESGTLDFVLHPGKYLALPTSKLFLYSDDHDNDDPYAAADTSAGNKAGTSAYGVAYATTGPTFIDPPGYFIASGANASSYLKLTASGNYFDADIEEDFFKNQMMGNDATGHAEADHIGLFGECHADEVATLQTISALGDSTDFANTKLTLSAVGNDIASGATTYIGAYASVARLNGSHTASVTTITFENNAGSNGSANAQMFKKYDIIRIGNELMQITGGTTSQTTFTVERGVLGTTAVAHADQDAIGFHYMNETLAYLDSGATAATAGCTPMEGVSNIYTSSTGTFAANTFFGLGRDFAYPSGLVPGTVGIKFYSTASLALGIGGCTPTTVTGLAASTAYEFKITVDGGTQTTMAFTTDAEVQSLGNPKTGVGVLSKIQTQLDGTYNKDVSISIQNGDIVFSGNTRYRGKSTIVLAAGSDGAVAELFGTGIFPAVTAIRAVKTPQTPTDENIDNIMFDDGMGRLKRKNGGVGSINYETGAFRINNCPPNSHMKIACTTNSALSGNVKSARNNYIPAIKARSLSAFRDAYVRVIAYDDIIDDDNVEILMNSVESDGTNRLQRTNTESNTY